MPERIGQPAGQPTPTHDARPTEPLPQPALDAITRLETALAQGRTAVTA